MANGKRLSLLGCALSIAVLFATPLIPIAIAQESQQRGTALKDVCSEGWSRYHCHLSLRVCVSPEVENQYDLHKSFQWGLAGCNSEPTLVPEVWTHATAEESGYLYGSSGNWFGYQFYTGVINLDSSMIKDGDLEKAISNLPLNRDADIASFNHGVSEYIPSYLVSLESYKIPVPATESKSIDVCPVSWSRFSCQFIRLCVSPRVVGHYDLASSKEFSYARCKSDNRFVPEEDTHFSPHDVGEGALLVDRVYFKAVKLDSSDIFEGDIEEAIERLVLVPIPPSALMEYDRGYKKGLARFLSAVAKTNQKQTQSDNAKSPQ